MEKFANALAETFMEKYPNVTVQAEFTGSSAGIESVLAGQCDVGDSSRALKDDEKAKGAVENIVAIDGIAVVVDPSNAVDGLSKDELTGIYDGSITNWKDVGGSDMPIVVVGREAGSVQEAHLRSFWVWKMPANMQTSWIPPVQLWQK